MITMSLAGATLGRKSAEAALEFRFYGLVGPTGAQVIQSILQDAHRPGLGTFTGIAGSVLLLVGASAIFVELQDAFNTIWHVESERSGLWQIVVERFLSFLLVLITEALLLLSVLLSYLRSRFSTGFFLRKHCISAPPRKSQALPFRSALPRCSLG